MFSVGIMQHEQHYFQMLDKLGAVPNLNLLSTVGQNQENLALDRAARFHRNSACKYYLSRSKTNHSYIVYFYSIFSPI